MGHVEAVLIHLLIQIINGIHLRMKKTNYIVCFKTLILYQLLFQMIVKTK
jgi:hypothetical protein